MRHASWLFVLGVILLPLLVFAAENQAQTTQILTASPTHTVVAAEFDQAALNASLSTLEFAQNPASGLGTYLAIAGHGAPVAHVQSFELGDAVSTTFSLPEQNIASSADELVILGEPAVIHDLRIVPFNYRALMRDAAGVVRTVRRVQAEVSTIGAGSSETTDPTSFSAAFAPVYRTMVSNLDEVYPEMSTRTPGRYLVVTTPAHLTALESMEYWQEWKDLKLRKGYELQIEAPANHTRDAIRTLIQSAYDDHSRRDLEYVLLIGNNVDLPSFELPNPEYSGDNSIGDNLFAATVGTDLLPDILIGRISGRADRDYAAYFAKVMSYETAPYTTDMNWFRSVTLAAGNYATDGTYPVTPVWNIDWARERMLRSCITNADTFFFHGWDGESANQYTVPIRQDIDSGVCAVFYRGWAGSQLWQFPVFANGNVQQLNNVGRTPAVFAIVCASGNFGFSNGPCLGEMFTTGYGTVTQPKGAIVFVGASDLHTNTSTNNAILSGILEAILDQGVRSTGALLMAGKMEGWRQFPLQRNNGPNGPQSAFAYYYVLHCYNLLGDPETQIYFCPPGTMDVTNPSTFSSGTNLVPVTVTSGGQPVDNAVVTLRAAGDTVTIAAARTDGAGQAYLPAHFASSMTQAELTVWKSRYFLKEITIPVSSVAYDPQITAINWSDGGDNKPNPGETVNFTLSAHNAGTSAATPNVTITSLDSRITVTSGSGSIPAMQPGADATSSQFTITLGGQMWNGEHPRLSIVLQDGSNSVTREVEVPVAAPEIVIDSVIVADGGNNILEAGEQSIPITITATNVGSQNAQNLSVRVYSFDSAISFGNNGGGATWTQLNMGETATSGTSFTASLAGGVTPGRQVLLRFEFSMNGSICARSSYLLPTGVVTIHSPTGPDDYGYYAYEDIDNGYGATPTYQWVELGGGNGDAHDVHDDTHFAMRLPASFTYYGQSFDSVWICSNGWFSFERTPIPEFRNWELPSPIGAPSLVAPFWTDLVGDRHMPNDDTLHYVWTKYDPDHSRFIIQWRTFLRAGLNDPVNNDSCTFEAILEYPQSGDGSILLQYSAIKFHNASGGNYATVGWEDSNHMRGMTLTFADMFPASVDTMRAGRAIRITRQTPDSFTGTDPLHKVVPRQFTLHEAYPNPFNPTTQLQFDLPQQARTTLKVYDMLGREVATLVDGMKAAGSYTVSFDAVNLPTGLYFARLTSGANTQVRKLMLIK